MRLSRQSLRRPLPWGWIPRIRERLSLRKAFPVRLPRRGGGAPDGDPGRDPGDSLGKGIRGGPVPRDNPDILFGTSRGGPPASFRERASRWEQGGNGDHCAGSEPEIHRPADRGPVRVAFPPRGGGGAEGGG